MQEGSFDVRELLSPSAFAHDVDNPELRETHISWIVLTGTYAYKIKKPVRHSFIDASTLARRRKYCEDEVRLNRRLAPGLYLDVVPIAFANGRLRVGSDGPAVEYAVRMQQFPKTEELTSLLAEDAIGTADVMELGVLLANFHLSARTVDPCPGFPHTERMEAAVLDNLADLAAAIDPHGTQPSLQSLIDWTLAVKTKLQPVFRERERAGFVRECHGDLHSGNIVRWQGVLVPFDCIEFDAGLRYIDVMSDLAFLVMDFASRDRADLAFALLNRYLEVTGDYDGLQVLPFYAVYRALVRAKVDALTISEMPERAAEFRRRLDGRIHAAARWTEARPPNLLVMHGVSGSGKSWLSERLVAVLHAVRLRSDLERKRLAGITGGAASAPGEGIYTETLTHRVYARLADLAETGLRAGIDIIVDATFLAPEDRELFQSLAARLRAGFFIVACEAPRDVLENRIAERSRQGGDPSDATAAVLSRQIRDMQPFGPAEIPHVIGVSTTRNDAVAAVAAKVRG